MPEHVDAVLGKNITLTCHVEVGTNLSLTQSSWERRLSSGTITLAVFNPEFGISVADDYVHRVSFVNPSIGDASILLQGVGFADVGSYTCKVATFPLGNTQASTFVNILGRLRGSVPFDVPFEVKCTLGQFILPMATLQHPPGSLFEVKCILAHSLF